MVFGVDFVFLSLFIAHSLKASTIEQNEKKKERIEINIEADSLTMKCLNRTDRPMCRSDQKRIYGVARNELAKILCHVDAYPPPTSFKWSFNNTAETIDMPQSGFEKHSKTSSRLVYTPVKVCILYIKFFFIDVCMCVRSTLTYIVQYACTQFGQRKFQMLN